MYSPRVPLSDAKSFQFKMLYKSAVLSALYCVAQATTYALPSNDSFYNPSLSTYENASPGTILNHREVDTPYNMTGVAKSYQILYRTENALGDAEAAVTTLLVPENNGNSSRLISYQIAEDAAWIGCAPSYTLTQKGNSPDSSLQQLINLGYYVSTPDYEGPSSSFTAGLQAGHAVLDSVRAVLSSGNITGVSSDAALGMWGYSGGSLATGWAAQLQPSYAKELSISGVAVGGFVVNITAVMLYANDALTTGFIPAGLLGLASQYPEFYNLTTADLYPQNSSQIMQVLKQCVEMDLLDFAFKDFFDYFKSGQNILQVPYIKEVLENNTMGANAPTAPMFIYEGGQDEIVPIKIVNEIYSTYCDDGASIEYWVSPNTTHVGTSDIGQAYALQWLMERFEGKKVSSGCSSTTEVRTSLTLAATAVSAGSSNATATTTGSGSGSAGSASATGSGSSSASGSAAASGSSASGSASGSTSSATSLSAISTVFIALSLGAISLFV